MFAAKKQQRKKKKDDEEEKKSIVGLNGREVQEELGIHLHTVLSIQGEGK